MTIFLLALGAFVSHTAATLVLYWAVMALLAARESGRLALVHPVVRAFAYAVLYVGLALDALLSIVWGTLVFADWPRETLLTSRLIRYKRLGAGWRFSLAVWVCANMLDPFAPGGCHCRV